MRGLTVIVGDAARLRPALELAAAQAALGGAVRVFCQGDAVAGLRFDGDDARYAAAGLPTLAALFDDVIALGGAVIACQSGLALCGIEAGMLDPRITTGGLVGVMQTLGGDRLVLA